MFDHLLYQMLLMHQAHYTMKYYTQYKFYKTLQLLALILFCLAP